MPKGEKRKDPSEGGLKQTTMGSFFSLSSSKSSSKKSNKVSSSKTDAKLPPERHGKRRMWGNWAAKDTEEYRNRYPGKKEYPNRRDNLLFYTNELMSRPDGGYIDDIHKNWYGDYEWLERHHGYIQWLFPIRESGLNWHAQELQLHEIDSILKDKTAKERVMMSYKMMLDFYGMQLKDEETGEIERADNWKPRFRHLNRSFHNYLRITRILKCLGEFDFEYLKPPFIKFVLEEAFIHETLDNLLESCERYWIGVLRGEDAREEVWNYYEDLYLKHHEKENKKKEKTKQMVKEKKQNTRKDRVIDVDAEFESDPETLEYAMNMLDSMENSASDSESNKPSKERKVHTMSDSEEDSQEARYWNNEKIEGVMSQESVIPNSQEPSMEINGKFKSRKDDDDACLGSDVIEDEQEKDGNKNEKRYQDTDNDAVIVIDGESTCTDFEKSSLTKTDTDDNAKESDETNKNNNAESLNNTNNERVPTSDKSIESSDTIMNDVEKKTSENPQDEKVENTDKKNTNFNPSSNSTTDSIVNEMTDAMQEDNIDSKEVTTNSADKEVICSDNMNTDVESNQEHVMNVSDIKKGQEDEMDVAVDEKIEEPMESEDQ